MKLTELNRIYFLRSQVYDYQVRQILEDTTHLGYVLDGNIWLFCSGSGEGAMPQFVRKYRHNGKCQLGPPFEPDEKMLEEFNSECDGVSCPECLAIAIKGEIPEPKPTVKPLMGTTGRKS